MGAPPCAFWPRCAGVFFRNRISRTLRRRSSAEVLRCGGHACSAALEVVNPATRPDDDIRFFLKDARIISLGCSSPDSKKTMFATSLHFGVDICAMKLVRSSLGHSEDLVVPLPVMTPPLGVIWSM